MRRGSERLLHELSSHLAERGHDVTVVSTSPDGPRVEEGRVRRVLLRQLRPPSWFAPRLTSAHLFGFQCRSELVRGRFDAAFCLTHYDAFAAARSARPALPFVFHYPGIPWRRAFRTFPLDALMFGRARRGAAVVAVVSRNAADRLAADYGAEAQVLPPPVDLERFRPGARDPGRPPTLLMVGAMEERRKGARLLARAFGRLKREIPELRLQLSGQISAETTAEILALVPSEHRGDVELLGAGRVEDLPGLYAGASVTVLPAVWETLGLVLIESLASGTPVVGANHGGIPDIVTSADVGELFEPGATRPEADNLEGLEEAIRRALALATRPETADRCRKAAERFGWAELGPRYERLLAEAVS